MQRPTSKIAVVTGAGSGIGRAASLALAEMGFSVVLAGRRVDALEKVAEEIGGAGGHSLAVAADVGKVQDTKALFAKTVEAYGRVDLLFNNAGSNARVVPLEELDAAEWQAVLDVNVTGAFLCTQEAVRIMKNQLPRGGRIINNGSISSMTPRPNSAPYTVSKHAITGLTKSTALDGRAFDIACGQIDIGNAVTAISSHVRSGALQPDGSRLVEPTVDLVHIADAIKYMAGLPLSANVLSMTVMATKMPLVGRG